MTVPATADLVISGGTVIDGTGAPRLKADVAVTDDRIVAVGDLSATQAGRRVDAAGKVVAPGFVDVHTHLHAQLAWDPIGTSTCWHGAIVQGPEC